MAREFVGASSEYLEVDVAAITAYPFSMACWFKAADITDVHILVGITDKNVHDYQVFLAAHGNLVDDPVRAFAHEYGGAAAQSAYSTAGYSANTWQHACGVWSGVSSRAAYLNGGNKGIDANTVGAMVGHDRTSIGAVRDSTPNYSDAQIAEVGIWNVVLTDAEVAELAAGVSPLFVRPSALVGYWPLHEDDGDICWTNAALNMSAGGTPTYVDHPPIIYPSALHLGRLETAVGGGLSIPIAMHHYKQLMGAN